jgi:hypothetical protein
MRPHTPQITKKPNAKVLTITTIGNPNAVAQSAIGALYGTAYGTKFKVYKPKGKNMDIGCLSAQWPDAHRKPKARWKGVWALEVSRFVTQKDLIQKDPKNLVKVANWKFGTVAQVLYLGPYNREKSTIEKLHAYIREQGYKLAGPHEEVYLTKPDVKVPKTIIRYVVRKRKK